MPNIAESGPGYPGASARSDRLELYKLAYAESVRALEFQGKQLDGVRLRTVQYLAFVGTATAFLVGTSLSGPTRDGLFYAVAAAGTVVAFISVALAARILLLLAGFAWPLPRLKWSFAMSGKRLVEWIEPQVGAPSEVDYLRALAVLNDKGYEANEVALKSLGRAYSMFIIFGFVQLMVWVVLAWLRG